MEKKEKLVLIDGNSLINRAFYALPLLKNSSGEYSNAVFGFCNILIKLIEAEKPKYCAVAFDMGHPTFRHEIYPEYKAKRKKMPDELAVQMPILKAVLEAMNIKFVERPGIEADDLVGTLAKKFDTQTIIVSGDRDLFQLVDNTTSVWFTKKGVTEATVVTPQNIKEVYGVEANQVADLKGLMGDSSDNIKGVAGVGDITAKKLIDKYGSIENLFEHIEDMSGTLLHDKLVAGEQNAKFSKQLATIKNDVELDFGLNDLEFDFPFKKSVFDIFSHYEFGSLTKRAELFDENEVTVQRNFANVKEIKTLQQVDELVQNLATTKEIAVCFLDDGIHIANSKFEENIITIDKNGFDYGIAISKLKVIFENENIKKCFINTKEHMHILNDYGIQILGVGFDANIAVYLLSGSNKTNISAKDFAEKHGYDENNVAVSILFAKPKILEELESEGMTKLYQEIELPLVDVLFEMEKNGFKVDMQKLAELRDEYSKELEALTNQIFADANEEFNIKSPKQLGVVLFEHLALKLPRGMKPSTGVEVLERITDQHPIVEKILRYRKIEKLLSTYVEPFEKLADTHTNLIHTIFHQTLTSTGRLSSSDPNLQNIPIRDEEGKNLRKVFIPREPNGKIVTSDYSQIELRLIAHFSQDPNMLFAYQNGIDVHAQTASQIFDVPIGDVTPKMRTDAKAVNFGIIYGISDYGLAQQINTSRNEAKEFIEKYFQKYGSVKAFMDKNVAMAREKGYVSTLFGRKRNIVELTSSNYMTRLFGERAAMNMPVQGTASDIIKIAMVRVFESMKKHNLKSKLILQIHDELIVDTCPEEEEIVKKILKEEMENATKLSVPLTSNIEAGANWFEAK